MEYCRHNAHRQDWPLSQLIYISIVKKNGVTKLKIITFAWSLFDYKGVNVIFKCIYNLIQFFPTKLKYKLLQLCSTYVKICY